MNTFKVIGWITFGAGLAIILFSLYSTYQIFTGEKLPPQIFAINLPQEESLETPAKAPTSQEEMMELLQQQLSSQFSKMIPSDTLPKLLNLLIWTVGAGVLIFGGSQISSLGIKLVKE
ncbi:MAG: hypothetical protein GF370_03500 [Candidatus Nealsonbacteria bacterium]|nr:hypothetical protein [Candidatus Nealsonbacteria bacterium]